MLSMTARLSILVVLCGLPVEAHGQKARKPASTAQKTPRPAKSETPLEDLKFKDNDDAGNDVRALKTEMLVAKSEKLAVEQINRLLRKYKGTPMEPDLWFRLAELHMRRSKTERFFELHRQSETVVQLAPALVQNASSKKAVTQAVDIYDSIERRFKGYHDLDVVIFNNAFARQSLGQIKNAEALYWKLIRSYPQSELVPDAHLAIGEMAFDEKRFKFALEHFEAIKKYPESRVYPYGLYKAGWSYYNLQQPESGIKELEAVVAYGRRVAEQNLDNRLDLRKEALMDMTIFYEDVYPSKNAFDYFRKQAGELEVGPVILRLGELYKRHSRYQDNKTLLTTFVKRLPESPSIPQVHEELIWNYENLKEKDNAVAQMVDMQKVCAKGGSWARAQKAPGPKDPQPSEACLDRLRDASLRLAGKWLRMWKKNPTYGDFADSAEKGFVVYLGIAPKTDEANEARYAYAELLFQRGKFREATTQYAVVGQNAPVNDLGHDARYASLVSLEKAVGDKWNDKDEKSFHEFAKIYLEKHPKGKHRLDVEFKGALIHYEKGRYEIAGPVFLRLGNEHAGTEKGLKAQDLYLDILNIKKDYLTLKDYAKHLMKPGLAPERQTKLTKIYEEAYFLQIQKTEELGKNPEAMAAYKKFAAENPKSQLAEKAWWNSVQLHFKMFDYIGGARASVEYYNRFPQSKDAINSLLKAAQTFESMGQLDEAADVLERLAKEDKKEELKWKALAADFYSLGGRLPKAKALYQELRKSKDRELAHQSLVKLEHLEKTTGTATAREALLREYMASGRQPQASLAALYFLEKTFEAKKNSKAFEDAKDILNMGAQASPRAKSRARFIQAQILEEEFRAQSVKSRLDRLALVLAIKTEKLEKAQSAYQSTMKYGDPVVAIEALRRLAACYGHYSESLRKMEIPAGLSADETQALQAELEKLAIPMEEKQVETIAEALTQAKRLGLRTGVIGEIQSEIDRLNMNQRAGVELKVQPPAIALPSVAGVSI